MKSAFPQINKIAFEGAKSKNPLAFKHYNADEMVEGKTMRDHLRFSVVYWHTFRGTGSDPFGVGTMLRPLGRRLQLRRQRPEPRPRRHRIHRETGRALLRLPRPRHRAGRHDAGRDQPQSRRRRPGSQGGTETHRHQTALGHGESVFQSALHARRGHQPQRRGLCLRRRAGEEGAGSHPRTRAAKATCSGAGAKVIPPC